MTRERGLGGLDDELLHELARPIVQAAETAQLGISVNLVEGESVRRVYVSEVAARILGYPREELVGNSTFISFAPGEAARMAELSRRWVDGESIPNVVESVVIGKDGSRRPVEVAYSLVERGAKRMTVSFIRDITERKHAHDALHRSESMFRQLIETAPEAVSVVSNDRFVYANPRFLQLLGCATFQELEATAPDSFLDPSERTGIEERRQAIFERSAVSPREYRVVRKDGGLVSVECSSLSIEFEGAPAVLTFVRDVTMRKEAQVQLMHQDRMATVGTLAAGVAHELNNPLAYVMLNLGLLEREIEAVVERQTDAAPIRERLRMVREGANRMASVVHDLRSFCRADGPPRPIDPREVLESAIDMAKHEIDGRARLVREYSPVPAVLADPARLGQVFLNLLVNATQAIAESRRKDHELRVVLRRDGDERVKVEFTDSGDGIAPDVIGRIFDPFFTTKPPGVGTGLGLSISKNIVLAMEGELTVESRVGEGSTFAVSLRSHGTIEPPAPDGQ